MNCFTKNCRQDSSNSTESSSNTAYIPLEDHLSMMQGLSTTSPEDESDTDTTVPLGSADADGDGTISVDGYDNFLAEMGITSSMSTDEFFTQYDTDGDGEISVDEWNASSPASTAPSSAPEEESSASSAIDTNGDGYISTAEYEAYIAQLGISTPSSSEFFAEYDTDSDGALSAAEIKSAYDSYAASALNAYEANFEYSFDYSSDSFNASI